MVAALAPHQPALLFEPDPLFHTSGRTTVGRRQGWRIVNDKVVRWHADDDWGAVVQQIIVRYAMCGDERGQLAREYAMSERGIQGYLSGDSWTLYAAPVIRALQRIGVSATRANRGQRLGAIAKAAALASADVVLLLADDPRPLAQRVVSDLRFVALAVGMELT